MPHVNRRTPWMVQAFCAEFTQKRFEWASGDGLSIYVSYVLTMRSQCKRYLQLNRF